MLLVYIAHFDGLMVRLAFEILSNTSLKVDKCSLHVVMCITMSVMIGQADLSVVRIMWCSMKSADHKKYDCNHGLAIIALVLAYG